MYWKDKIKLWKSGKYSTYPKNIQNRFFFETYVCDKNFSNIYDEKFIENNDLKNIEQNITPFINYVNQSKNNYVTSFYNLSGESLLIIPMPKKNKDFTTMKDFCDNASITQQKMFWKKVAYEIENILKYNNEIYISTHGLGVYYFHLRLDKKPKYYKTNNFIVK
jgi:hypothetical protein